MAHEYPWGVDVVEMTPSADGTTTVLTCVLCNEGIGSAKYLSEAINLWRGHQEEKRARNGQA